MLNWQVRVIWRESSSLSSSAIEMKVLFLDIDGVLNNGGGCMTNAEGWEWPYSDISPVGVARINRIVKSTGCKIVVSSSWRSNGIDFLNEVFKMVGLPEVHDITPHALQWRHRGSEIKSWLDNHKDVTSYVIIDDMDIVLDNQRKHFVQTDTNTGITREDADRAIEILNAPLAEVV